MTYLSETRIPSSDPMGILAGIAAVKVTLARWSALSRQRNALRTMSYSQLEDIGVSPAAATAEAARPFWASRHH